MGLGGYPYTTLAEARQAAFTYRKTARKGIDPRALKEVAPTFAEASRRVIAIHRKTWRKGSGSEHQWRASLVQHVLPHLGRQRVSEITPADVMATLLHDDLWTAKPVTASRVRQRISAVMKWAIAHGHRQDDPAGDALSAALPRQTHRKEHFRALPPAMVGQALAKVRVCGSRSNIRLAFEFLVLTAARQAEVRSAEWSEIAPGAGLWTVPAIKMKSGKPHRVPLSPRALEVLGEAAEQWGGPEGLVFPGLHGKQMHASILPELCRKLELGATPHGFRSSFRDFCAETGVSREVAEQALAHAVKNRVEAAYRRSDLLAQRREVMAAWAAYLAGGGR